MTKRQIFIDTETTGLSAKAGHRVVELAAVEAIDGKLTGRQFHTYLNPGRAIDPYAQKVHGLSSEFLSNKPRFSDVANEFVNFVQGAECLMHNAPFDTAFIDAELTVAGHSKRLQHVADIVCTVSLARAYFPGESATLDSLIEKAGISVKRKNHSALEDAQLLATVYFNLLSKKAENPYKTMHPNTTNMPRPDLIPHIAKYAERYLTLHRAHPTRTYSYIKRGFENQPVVEVSRHAHKCSQGETWMYIAVPSGAELGRLAQEERLYVGAQTQDRMFRGDNLAGDNFHHAEMRKGNGAKNLISFLRSGQEVDIFRFSGPRISDEVKSNGDLQPLEQLSQQVRTARKHLGWWYEQYVLFREPNVWRWNTDPADKIIKTVVQSAS